MITVNAWQRGSLDSGAEYWYEHPHLLRPFVASLIVEYQQKLPGLLANAMEDLRVEVGIACDEMGMEDHWWHWIHDQEFDLIVKGIVSTLSGQVRGVASANQPT